MMHDSVLAHVAASLPQKENLATAALVYILNRSDHVRRGFQALVESKIGPMAKVIALRTEEANEDAKRPDIALVGEAGARVGFMEVKFWAGLTEAQPVAYLRALEATPSAVLLALAPSRRLPSLRTEFLDRCRDAGIATVAHSDVALQAGNTRIGLLTWSELTEHLGRAAEDDRRAAADVDQLRGLCEQVEAEGFFSLRADELDDHHTPRRYMMLAGLVDEIIERAVADGIGSVKALKATPRREGYGRYISLRHAGCWIGIDHESWARHGRSPIWIHFWTGDWGQGERLAVVLRSWIDGVPPARLHPSR